MKIDDIKQLLGRKGLKIDEIESVKSNGVNSNIYKIIIKGRKYCLKGYREDHTENNRQIREIRFLSLMQQMKIYEVPNILSYDTDKQWTILEWIQGRSPEKMTKTIEESFFRFIKKIAELDKENTQIAGTIGRAAESCMTVDEHIDILQKKIDQNRDMSQKIKGRPLNEEVMEMNEIARNKRDTLRNYKLSVQDKNMIISPSDVGLHNIICADRDIKFIDFEYSGWDDPLKLISDWCLRPGNMSKDYNINIAIRNIENITKQKYKSEEIQIMCELSALKWICIIQKHMLKEYSQRGQALHKIEEDRQKCLSYKRTAYGIIDRIR